ncbi:MAG TPA: DUF2071 domain-containing protein [Gemmatimonadales bacterium]|nr:DUF2071 domain-containing protein [Gemmatimonadales bacterium]
MTERSRPFLTAQWRNLIILTYAVDPMQIIERVPAGTTLDSWHGKTFVSLLGFQFQDTKVLGASIPFHQDFEEVNLRFYVRRVVGDDVRPGVVFIRELVPRPLVGGMARLLYREPYLVVHMRSAVQPGPPPRVSYAWDLDERTCVIAGAGEGEGTSAAPGSLEEFVTQRPWGYNGERGKDTLEYYVHHPTWRLWEARNLTVDYDAAPICGGELARQLTAPISTLIADGSAVTVHWRNQII